VTAEFLLFREQHLELEVRVREDGRHRHQLGEELMRRAALGGTATVDAAIVVKLHQPASVGDGEHQAHAMVGQQRAELGAHGAKVARLDLDQDVAGHRVDDVAADVDLEATAGWGGVPLEGRVQGRLVERADSGHPLRIPARMV